MLLNILVLFILCSCVGTNNYSGWPIQVTFVVNEESRSIHLEKRRRIDLFDVPVNDNENAIGLYTDKSFVNKYDGQIIEESKTFYVKCNELNYSDYRMLSRIDSEAFIRVKVINKIPGLYYACYGSEGPISVNRLYYVYQVQVLEVYTKNCVGNSVNGLLQVGALFVMGMIQELSLDYSYAKEFVIQSVYPPQYDPESFAPLSFKGINGLDPKLKGDILVTYKYNTFPIKENKVSLLYSKEKDGSLNDIFKYYDFYPILQSRISIEDLSEWFDVVFYKQVAYENKYNKESR